MARTALAADRRTEHGTRPLQAPDQPANRERAAGVTRSATTESRVKVKRQAAGQEMPAGRLVTFPAAPRRRTTETLSVA